MGRQKIPDCLITADSWLHKSKQNSVSHHLQTGCSRGQGNKIRKGEISAHLTVRPELSSDASG